MASARLTSILDKLVMHWEDQHIKITPRRPLNIALLEASKGITLPDDFKEFFRTANGMGSYYPNDMCDAGFLFYPLEGLVTSLEEFGPVDALQYNGTVLIFAEYLHKSWWYGVMLNGKDGTYQIGIIPDRATFKPITDSLAVFIELYLRDDGVLYDYT